MRNDAPYPQHAPPSTTLQRAVTRETVSALWSEENFLASPPSSHSGTLYKVSNRVLEGVLLGVWDYSPCQPSNVYDPFGMWHASVLV